MRYFERVKEIQLLQWELFMDYWFLHLGIVLVGLAIVIYWLLRNN
jgi:hypothetical protein